MKNIDKPKRRLLIMDKKRRLLWFLFLPLHLLQNFISLSSLSLSRLVKSVSNPSLLRCPDFGLGSARRGRKRRRERIGLPSPVHWIVLSGMETWRTVESRAVPVRLLRRWRQLLQAPTIEPRCVVWFSKSLFDFFFSLAMRLHLCLVDSRLL